MVKYGAGALYPTAAGWLLVLGFLSGCGTSNQRPVVSPVPAASEAATPAEAEVATNDLNDRLVALSDFASAQETAGYRIGPEDELDVTVFEAEELSRPVRVSATGDISMPLLGTLPVAGLTPREVEELLVSRLKGTYMVDPYVTVTVTLMQSHPVSVVGAVNQPGVVQVSGSKTLLEVLALAEGLAPDAGETVVVMRANGPAGAPDRFASTESAPSTVVDLATLLESADPSLNVPIFAGDIIKVQRAGVIYVVGELNRPGSFPLRAQDDLTVLRAVALGEGLLPTASKSGAVIIRTVDTGQQFEVPIDLGDILAGRAPDLPLQSEDILFVPNSASKSLARGLANAFVRMITLRAVF